MPTVGYKKKSWRKAQGLERGSTGKRERANCLDSLGWLEKRRKRRKKAISGERKKKGRLARKVTRNVGYFSE